LKSHYRFRHLEDNKFELADYLKKDEHAGRFLVRSEKDASIWFDDGPDLFRDDFDKPKWLNVKKIAEASAPGEHAQ
jgi:hypothetical protein